MVARRQGQMAILHCTACGHERKLLDGRFEDVNDFIQRHKGCVQAA